jgi:hypothetical protein
MKISDGKGTGVDAHVNKNHQLLNFSISQGEDKAAAGLGNAFNINTGTIAFSTNSSTRTTLLYFKNDENTSYIVNSIAVGLGTRSATVSDAANVFVVRGPTTGTTISNANDCDMISNNNFGSSNTLSTGTLAYKGADGEGATSGGTDHALLYMSDGRLFASLNIEIPKGSSIAIEIDGNTSGTFNVYAALVGYIEDANSE